MLDITADDEILMRAAAPPPAKVQSTTIDIPLFEGIRSRRHEPVSINRLRVSAEVTHWRHRKALSNVDRFVQFTGFPRSGHSLIGALLGAHPNAEISHELNAMGLYQKGMPASRLPAACFRAAKQFRSAGQWWNGLNYVTNGLPPKGPLKVVGDKKGDWASRWYAHDPSLLRRLQGESPLRLPFVLITRHPLDNIATMSLRKGRAYDRIRIEAPREEFDAALRRAQEAGEVPKEALDEMIVDYAGLCAATAGILRDTAPTDRYVASYETITVDPVKSLGTLARFLDLPADEQWAKAAGAKIRPAGESRGKLRWTNDQLDMVDSLVQRFGFLSNYAAR